MQRFEREIRAAILFLLGLAFLMPVIVGRRYLFPFVFPKGIFHIVIVELALLLYLLLLSIDRKYLPRFNLLMGALLLYFVAMIFANFFGVDPGNSFWSKAERMDGLFNYLHYFIYAVILVGVMRKESDWLKMFQVLMGFGILTGIVALVAKFAPDVLDYGGQPRLGASFGNPAFLSTYFVTLWFIAVIFALRAGERLAKIVYWVIAAFFLFLVALSQTRGAVIGLTIGIGIFLLALLFSDWRKWWRVVAVFFAAGVCLVTVALVFRQQLERGGLGQLYSISPALFRDVKVWPRYYSAKMGWEGFLAKPTFGWGPENFMYVFNRHFEPEIHTYELSLFDRAHNKPIDILSMYGIFGFVAYSLLWGLMIITLLLMLRRRVVNPVWTGGLMGMMVTYFVQNIFLFEMPTSNLIFFFLIAFFIWFFQEAKIARQKELEKRAAAPSAKIHPPKNRVNSVARHGLFPSWVTLPAAVIIAFSLWVGAWQPSQASRGVVDVSILLSRGQEDPRFFAVALEHYRRGRGLDTHINREFDVSMARRIREVYGSNAAVVENAEFKTLAIEVMANLQKDFERHPMDYDVLIEKGNIAFLLQSRYTEFSEAARESWEKSKTVSPKREDAYHQLALWYASRGEFREADQEMAKLMEINSKVGRYWWFKTIVDLQGGKELAVIKDDLAGSGRYNFSWYEPRNGLYVVHYLARNGRWPDASEIYELMIHSIPKGWWSGWSTWGEPLLTYLPQAFAIFEESGNLKKFEALEAYILERVPAGEKEKVSQAFTALAPIK